MDFVVGLPKTLRKYHLIWVIIDKLTKSAYFDPVKVNYKIENQSKTMLRGLVVTCGSNIYQI